MFVVTRVLNQHRTFLVTAVVVVLIYEVIRWHFCKRSDPCTRNFYREMYLIAKHEIHLYDREKLLKQVLDETLVELIRLQVVLDINSTVLHNSYNKLQELFVLISRISTKNAHDDNENITTNTSYDNGSNISNSSNDNNKNNNTNTHQLAVHVSREENETVSESLTQEMQEEANNIGLNRSPNQSENKLKRLSALKTDVGFLKYSCREVYRGSLFGYPEYAKGFERENCTDRIPISESVSLIIDRPVSSDNQTIQQLLQLTGDMFKHIYVIYEIKYKSVFEKLQVSPNTEFRQFDTTVKHLGEHMNSILRGIVTPFAFILRRGMTIIENSYLERLIDVAESFRGNEMPERDNSRSRRVIVVGVALRNSSTGAWNRNCHLSSLKLYILKYRKGYESSTDMSCLYCHHMEGSFLLKFRSSTTGVQSQLFNSNLTHGVFQDFFLRLKETGQNKVVACPDVQLDQYLNDEEVNGDLLVNFADAWDIKKIEYSDKRVHWFGCRAGFNYTSSTRCPYHTGMALPPCCMENIKEAIAFIFQQCDLHNIDCQLIEGSVLGMVKFQGILPWERDVDIRVPSSAIEKFHSMRRLFEQVGYTIVNDESSRVVNSTSEENIVKRTFHGGVLHVRAHGWTIQIFGYDDHGSDIVQGANSTGCFSSKVEKCNVFHSSNTLEASGRDMGRGKRIRTKMKLNNQWVYLPHNPGRYSRHRYGFGIYRHAEHWMSSRMRNGWEQYRSGKFEKCYKPGHHACLNRYTPDGDICFQESR